MRGSVPARGRILDDLGGKPISDLIGTNIRMAWRENDCTVTGDIKCVADPWEEYSKNAGEQTGHFFPYVFDSAYKGKEVTYGNRKAGDMKITIGDDCTLIQRVENLNDSKGTYSIQDGPTLTIDFSGADLLLPAGQDAIDADKTDFGAFGNHAAFYEGGELTGSWDEKKCVLTGQLNKVDKVTYNRLKEDGYYIGIGLKHEWFDGEQVTAGIMDIKTAEDTDWVFRVTEEDKDKPLTIKVGDQLIAEYDLSGLTLNEG